MERYHVYLMSGKTLHINATDENHAKRVAIVWHQHTDAVELVRRVEMKSRIRGKEARVVRVVRPKED